MIEIHGPKSVVKRSEMRHQHWQRQDRVQAEHAIISLLLALHHSTSVVAEAYHLEHPLGCPGSQVQSQLVAAFDKLHNEAIVNIYDLTWPGKGRQGKYIAVSRQLLLVALPIRA